jgi:hypothetical protein
MTVLKFKKWLEDAGPLGPAGASHYINDKTYAAKGARPKRTTKDDDGESNPDETPKRECLPEKLFGFDKMKKKQKKKCRK